jgi:RNA binding exosome subunit
VWIGRKEFDELCEQVGRYGNRIYQLEQTLKKADAKRMKLMEKSIKLQENHEEKYENFLTSINKKIEELEDESSKN